MLRHTAAHNPVRQPDMQRDHSGTEGNSMEPCCAHISSLEEGGGLASLRQREEVGRQEEPAEVFICRVGVGL